MARTFVIGLTGSGKQTTVNEDTFSLSGRVYPDMITGSEEQTGSSTGYNQLYVVTEGVGGPGVGDLAGRIIQRTAHDLADLLGRYQSPSLDFRKFSRDLVKEAHNRVLSQIKPRGNGITGASMALLLIDANTAYVLNVGQTDSFLFRGGELFLLCSPADNGNGRRTALIGDSRSPAPSGLITTREVDLKPGDIILLTSSGFRTGYKPHQLIEDLSSPDAFAASIRQAQIHSRKSDDSASGTVLALKVRDLELSEPGEPVAGLEIRKSIYHKEIGEDQPESEKAGKSKGKRKGKGDDAMARERKEKRKGNLKTFFLFLLLGFLIGLAAILFVWFLILK
ncbi:MAG TPA: hypothetical protein PK646_06935 [Bacillota bacterium]|nr:hypothetical protein [Fastidiosipila sp.]HPX93901.1 hypothetical protein [Bacillota bacterium]HQB81797.1 hypothetical protein [Bacillota bacterium]